MNSIPRGSTQKNVNQVVYDFIRPKIENSDLELRMIDAPCGSGEFAHYLGGKFPKLKVNGVDLFTENQGKNFEFHKMSAHDYFNQQKPESADIVTCISGVMCFDGIPDLITKFYKTLKPSGIVVLTNDNIMTVRDRLNFLFFGHFKRFKLLYANNEGNWNLILPQALVAHLKRNGFHNLQVKYTAIYTEDLLFIPLAILLYPLFLIYLLRFKSEMTRAERLTLFPFRMLISRHYVIAAAK